MSDRLRIIIGGMAGQFPLGGMAWDYFHYMLALDSLGHDVYYHEDTWCCPFDPNLGHLTEDPAHTLWFLTDFFRHHAQHLSNKWHYQFMRDRSFGMSRAEFDEVARTADIFLNVSGACFFPDHLNPSCRKVLLDTDPGYNQFVLSEKYEWSPNARQWFDQVSQHDRHLTYAQNIHGNDCIIPKMHFNWQPTRCVVTLPSWKKVKDAPFKTDSPFSTVMTLNHFAGPVTYQGQTFDSKILEFLKFLNLPTRAGLPLTLAIANVKISMQSILNAGWTVVDGAKITESTDGYMQFIADSSGEWSIAKNVYVATRSGWFSTRTACYLAAGRPAVVQDTAWSKFIPAGAGLLKFDTIDEAVEGLHAVRSDPQKHRAAAYEIAREYLATDRVMPGMLRAILD